MGKAAKKRKQAMDYKALLPERAKKITPYNGT
jgi:hypothetical protein